MDSIFDLVFLLTHLFLPLYLPLFPHIHLDCQTLRIEKFNVPEAISNGSHAILYCDYNLENSELYSVKFYKDYIEFYRYLPKEEDYPKQSFNLDGIYLDVNIQFYQFFVIFVILTFCNFHSLLQLKKSNATHVILHHTDLVSFFTTGGCL